MSYLDAAPGQLWHYVIDLAAPSGELQAVMVHLMGKTVTRLRLLCHRG
jgi:hypothetical protein